MNREVQGQLSQRAVMQCKGAAEQSSMVQRMRRAKSALLGVLWSVTHCQAAVLQRRTKGRWQGRQFCGIALPPSPLTLSPEAVCIPAA